MWWFTYDYFLHSYLEWLKSPTEIETLIRKKNPWFLQQTNVNQEDTDFLAWTRRELDSHHFWVPQTEAKLNYKETLEN